MLPPPLPPPLPSHIQNLHPCCITCPKQQPFQINRLLFFFSLVFSSFFLFFFLFFFPYPQISPPPFIAPLILCLPSRVSHPPLPPTHNDNDLSGGVGRGLALAVTIAATFLMCFFSLHSSYVSSLAYSSPSIVIEAGRTQTGGRILYDDYREAYYWLRHNTDPDAKIMSWWDYGYQVMRDGDRDGHAARPIPPLAEGVNLPY